MKKTIVAVTVGLLLVSGQAVASNSAATARVGDRVGARADDSSKFQFGGAGLGPIVMSTVTIVSVVSVLALAAQALEDFDESGS